jgi:Cohesin domain.
MLTFNRFLKQILGIFLLFLVFSGVFFSVEAAFLKIDPNAVSSSAGNNFDVKVILDPESDAIYSTDIYLTYDQSLLKVVSVKAENLFPTVIHNESTSGKIYIAAMVNDPTSSISSSGTVATITFQGLKDGSGNLSFDCSKGIL